MEKGFYHFNVGYWQAIVAPSEDVLSSYPEGTQEVPLKPGEGYNFDGTSWVAPSQEWLDDKASKKVRAERDFLLRKEVDPVVSNPLRWAAMSDQEKEVVASYRQALLDVTKQAGFPHSVVWPVKSF